MKKSWKEKMGDATLVDMRAVGKKGNAEKFMDTFKPEKAVGSTEAFSKVVVDHVAAFNGPFVKFDAGQRGNSGSWSASANLKLDFPCALIEDGALDPSNVLAAHLMKCSVESELRIEYYATIPSKNIAEHVVIANGAAAVCEFRPLRDTTPGVDRIVLGYRRSFRAQPQNESEDLRDKEEAERVQRMAKRKRGGNEPWYTHPDDFLAVPRTDEVTALEEKFKRQAALLAEVVEPVEYADTYVRSKTMQYVSQVVGDDAYAQHMGILFDIKSGRSRLRRLLFDVVVFQAAENNCATVGSIENLGEIPFQGRGGFGLAVVPANLKRGDVDEVLVKIALSQFLGATSQDLECIVLVRTSKLNLKRLQDIEDAGIPIVFDFSGRTNPAKEIKDPLDGVFSKQPMELCKFNGRLDESQVALLGDALDRDMATRMLHALEKAVLEGVWGNHAVTWKPDIIDTLTYGREKVGHSAADTTTFPLLTALMSREPRSSKKPWQFLFATFPPESMPTLDSAEAVKRMHDVGTIWNKTLREYGLVLRVERASSDQRGKGQGPYTPNRENLQEIGRFLGIDAMIDSLYDGVPLDYII